MKDLFDDFVKCTLHPPHLKVALRLALIGIAISLIIKPKK
jgi:hypothetical protein